ncbi:GHKL domain-containing protein [Bacillus sp. B15-48]|nr:sensor histidine kinase [Bacillus sp. B15-48]MBM4761155.1 GHKL domain-containing protein [Bacillus sp. B15-48]
MYKRIFSYLIIMIAVSIAGEMKFYPFESGLRVSLGTPVFFFILLWARNIQPILAGVLVGFFVVMFRTLLATYSGNIAVDEIITRICPVFFYYLMFAVFFQVFKVNKLNTRPLYIGLFGIIIEIIASLTEIFVRSFFIDLPFTKENLLTIAGIAVIRSFLVLGFYNILVVRDMRQAEEAQRKRNEEMLMHISNIHIESIQLKKTMKNAEQLTSDCYVLYRRLKESGNDECARMALRIVGEVHETKKDNQRIYAGLSKLMHKEYLSDYLSIHEIIELIATANTNYAKLINKQIKIKAKISGSHPPYHTFILLSIINNLVANAIEAIDHRGEILLTATLKEGMVNIYVKDNGPGITSRNRQLIFNPGFTTKFDQNGMASNGIGLTYVKDMIANLNGEIGLENHDTRYTTVFRLNLPIDGLTEKG